MREGLCWSAPLILDAESGKQINPALARVQQDMTLDELRGIVAACEGRPGLRGWTEDTTRYSLRLKEREAGLVMAAPSRLSRRTLAWLKKFLWLRYGVGVPWHTCT